MHELKPKILQKIDTNQFGFIPKSCTTHAIISMLHSWLAATDGTGSTVKVALLDDSTISEVIPRTENRNLQDIVDQVANWSNNNKFQLNSGKCKELRINFTKDPCRDEPVKVNDKHFEVVTSAKILGMTITDDLK